MTLVYIIKMQWNTTNKKRPERTTFKPLPFVYKVNYLPNLIETPIKPVT